MTVTTRSQGRKISNAIPLNAKGHPSIGMLTIKSTPKTIVNPFISRCDSLENTARMLYNVLEIINLKFKVKNEHVVWFEEIYRKLFDYINRDMNPSFDDIDAMLLVCSTLFDYSKKLRISVKNEFSEFILNCPEKFLITYVNNSETSLRMFYILQENGMENICKYLLPYVHYTKLGTWNERINSHIRGNLTFESNF
jgi:hypothetical protein